MRPWKVLLTCCAALAACGGVSPDPARMASDLPAARDLDPATAAANRDRLARAVARLEDGDVEAARALAEEVLETDPRAGRARAIRAAALAAEAQATDPPELVAWRRAEGEFRRATALEPDDPVVAILHARFLRDDGHWTAAAERAERLLATHPDDLAARRLAGVLRYDLGDERAAIVHLERVVDLDPGDADSIWRLAHARLRVALAEPEKERRQELLAGALAAFSRYRELVPVDANGPLGEARARIATFGESPDDEAVAEVLRLYETAGRLAPGSPEPSFGRGVVLDRIGDAGGAENAYREALAIDGAHVPSLLNLAANLAGQGRTEEARAFARRALDGDLARGERRAVERFLAAPTEAETPP